MCSMLTGCSMFTGSGKPHLVRVLAQSRQRVVELRTPRAPQRARRLGRAQGARGSTDVCVGASEKCRHSVMTFFSMSSPTDAGSSAPAADSARQRAGANPHHVPSRARTVHAVAEHGQEEAGLFPALALALTRSHGLQAPQLQHPRPRVHHLPPRRPVTARCQLPPDLAHRAPGARPRPRCAARGGTRRPEERLVQNHVLCRDDEPHAQHLRTAQKDDVLPRRPGQHRQLTREGRLPLRPAFARGTLTASRSFPDAGPRRK